MSSLVYKSCLQSRIPMKLWSHLKFLFDASSQNGLLKTQLRLHLSPFPPDSLSAGCNNDLSFHRAWPLFQVFAFAEPSPWNALHTVLSLFLFFPSCLLVSSGVNSNVTSSMNTWRWESVPFSYPGEEQSRGNWRAKALRRIMYLRTIRRLVGQ